MQGVRTIWTFVRIAMYGGMIAFLALGQKSKDPTVSGFICGAILADLVTWVGISIVELPRFLRHITIDGVVNVVSLLLLFRFVGVEIPRDEERMAVAFLAFILIAVTKASFYLLERFVSSDEPSAEL